ncbi:DUF2249 domain-containing protein [Bradyrhizobium sp. G127]|uniref:DUF2249 domain-containing protein n=1 Tax=Bradyrhizobium sp. G127 TaxID=2904800 RepID=UPI001F1C1C47|nr:DUF2249 domain-containing protein [Bradyrhizobium sp. G127]MCF2524876.1 DUF2249 domain-containing protein [Bradyrhizobium sp. G127]
MVTVRHRLLFLHVVDVRDIAPQHRHSIIFQLFDHLEVGDSIQLVADHDPRPLRYQLEVGFDSQCKWTYLEQGPDVLRVLLKREAGSDESVG